MLVVNAPVYVLLQLFGIVNPGIYFVIGICFYFVLGVVIDFLGTLTLIVCDKIPHCPLRAMFK